MKKCHKTETVYWAFTPLPEQSDTYKTFELWLRL